MASVAQPTSTSDPKRPCKRPVASAPVELGVDCIGAIFEYVPLFSTPPLARVSTTWRAAAAARLLSAASSSTALGRALLLDSALLPPFGAGACATIDMTDRKCKRRFLFRSGDSRVTVRGGYPIADCALSGPRSCVLALTPSPPLEPKAKKQAQQKKPLQTAAENGSAGSSSGMAAAAVAQNAAGAAAAAAGAEKKKMKKKPDRPVNIRGDSIIRGVTIESAAADLGLAVSGGHLVLLRCLVIGSVSVHVRARLTMIDCEVRRGSIKVGKDAHAVFERCTFGSSSEGMVKATNAASITVRECTFRSRPTANGNQAIVLNGGGIGALTVRNCRFIDVGFALMLIRCFPETHDIDGIDFTRTVPGNWSDKAEHQGAIFINHPDGSLRAKNIQYNTGETGGVATGALPLMFFTVRHGATLMVDDTPEMMAMPTNVVDDGWLAFCRGDDAWAITTATNEFVCANVSCYCPIVMVDDPEALDVAHLHPIVMAQFSVGVGESLMYQRLPIDTGYAHRSAPLSSTLRSNDEVQAMLEQLGGMPGELDA